MPRRKNLTPSYLRHKATGRGRFVWTDPTGHHHDYLLPGEFDSAESRAAFDRKMLECRVSPAAVAREGRTDALTLNELFVRFLAFASMYYTGRDGKPASALVESRLTIRTIRKLYGELPATELRPLKLRAVQQAWVDGGLSRASCNKRLGIAKKIFRWAVAEEFVPPAVHQALTAVGGLQKGHTTAPDFAPIGPVDDATIDATLVHLNPHLRALIEVQRLTGMRPGEATRLRMCEIDITGEVWMCRPKQHKNEHRGHTRVIAIGKRAQEIITPFRTDDNTEYLFSPRKAIAEHFAERSAKRKTKKFPSEVKKLAAQKKNHRYNDRYTTVRYGIAIARACDKAFPPAAPLAQRPKESKEAWAARLGEKGRAELKKWQDAHRWAPNQLRHSFATKVRKYHGLEAAQVLLGHAKADITQVYAERDAALAVRVAAEIG